MDNSSLTKKARIYNEKKTVSLGSDVGEAKQSHINQ